MHYTEALSHSQGPKLNPRLNTLKEWSTIDNVI